MTDEVHARLTRMEMEVAALVQQETDPRWRPLLERLRDSFGPVAIGPTEAKYYIPEPKEGPWKG